MGLNGKAVLPMVLGLGCDTMATMTTRILATKKERIIATLLLVLGVPCSAPAWGDPWHYFIDQCWCAGDDRLWRRRLADVPCRISLIKDHPGPAR
jgi:hypothetical protein